MYWLVFGLLTLETAGRIYYLGWRSSSTNEKLANLIVALLYGLCAYWLFMEVPR